MSQYVESEFLARISPQQRVFLTRTAVLERLCDPLCDAVLELSGSAGVLEDLARSNLLLVPLDRRQEWYRYHRLFRDILGRLPGAARPRRVLAGIAGRPARPYPLPRE